MASSAAPMGNSTGSFGQDPAPVRPSMRRIVPRYSSHSALYSRVTRIPHRVVRTSMMRSPPRASAGDRFRRLRRRGEGARVRRGTPEPLHERTEDEPTHYYRRILRCPSRPTRPRARRRVAPTPTRPTARAREGRGDPPDSVNRSGASATATATVRGRLPGSAAADVERSNCRYRPQAHRLPKPQTHEALSLRGRYQPCSARAPVKRREREVGLRRDEPRDRNRAPASAAASGP